MSRPHSRPRLALVIVFLAAPIALCFTAAPADAAGGDAETAVGLELFEKHVRPTLLENCLRCHGEQKQQGGLRLDSRQGWMIGGDSGPAIVPGDPDNSLLVKAIRYQSNELEMPPQGILAADKIDAIEQWITLGAIDPRDADNPQPAGEAPPSVEQGREFWAFQPIEPPEVPAVVNTDWPKTDIDQFILARLEQQSLEPADDADPVTLLRRLFFDLTGLPPTPAQIDEFLSDPSPDAYPRLVDRLLDSPQFGERWGRHWLDVVRFAESSGGGRTLLFPEAWRYRDYVVDAFNRDLPYDQFLREQIAGDLIAADDWRDRRRKLIATAFLLLGPTNYEMQDKDILEMDVVDEQLDTIGKSMLGMTIGCARCHDHKFDPIPTRDYYAMAGILKSTKAMIHSNVSQWNTVELPVAPEQEQQIAEHQQRLAKAKLRLKEATEAWVAAGGTPDQVQESAAGKSIDAEILPGIVVDDSEAELDGDWTQSTSTSGFVGSGYRHDGSAGKGQKRATFRPQLPRPGRYEVQLAFPEFANRATQVPVHIHHRDGTSTVVVNQRAEPEIDGHRVSLGMFAFDPKDDPRVVISTEGTDGVVIADAVLFVETSQPKLAEDHAGEVENAQPDTEPGNADPRLLAELKAKVDSLSKRVKSLEATLPRRPSAMAVTDDEDAGDIHLAIRGVVHNRGPLVRRGVLQVISQQPFSDISENQSGRRELADWIATADNPLTARVIANRVWHWLIGRGIVTSVDNFGNTGQRPTHPELLDHLAISLIEDDWSIKALIRRIVHSRTYQMQSEATQPQLAADPENRWLSRMHRKRLHAEDIRDSLLAIGGNLELDCGGSNIKPGTKSEYGYQFESNRRSLYVPVFRNALPELFEVFDFADPNLPRGKRTSSTIASQALLLMNHPFVIDQSRLAARRLLHRPGLDSESRICEAFRQVLGRGPTPAERKVASQFLSGSGEEVDRWAMLYQTLFQSVDFRYLN